MMEPNVFLERAIRESLELKKSFFSERTQDIISFYKMLLQTRERGATAWIFGNGGSAADAQHFAAELMHRVDSKPIGLRAQALHTDTSLITAIANDEGYNRIFATQLQVLARPQDLAIGITTSGNSSNIIEGLKTARQKGCHTVGLLGRDGGKCAEICDLVLIVPHSSTPRIQEVHGMIIHLVCQMLEEQE